MSRRRCCARHLPVQEDGPVGRVTGRAAVKCTLKEMLERALAIAFLLANGLLVGCGGGDGVGSACDGSTEYLKCEGNQVLVCACTNPVAHDEPGDPICNSSGFTWIDGGMCSVACDVSIAPSSGCIASTQPVPECTGMDEACWNGNLVGCSNGYPLPATACSAGTQCTVVPVCEALCLPSSPVTDPSCSQAPGRHDVCVNNTALFCSCGFLLGSQACGTVACAAEPFTGFDGVEGTAATCGLPP